jgi:hypothetical protein
MPRHASYPDLRGKDFDLDIEILRALKSRELKKKSLINIIPAYYMAILSALNRQINHGHVVDLEDNSLCLSPAGEEFLKRYEQQNRRVSGQSRW